ncbi:hypothetical protein OF83DRAFT_1167226 [Amylostereum chailletii]|nr:hypothetical protein OF83DRAFT_1167226 [Amylostereum chailletii]
MSTAVHRMFTNISSKFSADRSEFDASHRKGKKAKSAVPQPEKIVSASPPALPAAPPAASPVAPSTAPPTTSSTASPTAPPPSTPPAPINDEPEEQEVPDFDLPSPTHTPTIPSSVPAFAAIAPSTEKAAIASLIAEYGSSSSTSWLEFSRYKIWRPTVPIPESPFVPVQGYLRSDPYVFAWGNPLVSDPSALAPTAAAFWDWARNEGLKIVWCCVDGQMEEVLGGKDSKLKWSTLSCIVEDMLDPKAVVDLAHSPGGGSEVKDFKKNLRRAEREHLVVREVKDDEWTPQMRKEVEEGILAWKAAKTGLQLASTSFQPWLDQPHRRYWVAEKDGKIVGILILALIHHDQYQIKNAASFPDAPRGTSEHLIYDAMDALHKENEHGFPDDDRAFVWHARSRSVSPARSADSTGTPSLSSSAASPVSTAPTSPMSSSSLVDSPATPSKRYTVTFGITASDSMTPVDNLSGWKISWLSATYNKVVGGTGLTRRGDFRNKFHTFHMPMYVCYPTEQGMGIDGVTKLIKCLRQ